MRRRTVTRIAQRRRMTGDDSEIAESDVEFVSDITLTGDSLSVRQWTAEAEAFAVTVTPDLVLPRCSRAPTARRDTPDQPADDGWTDSIEGLRDALLRRHGLRTNCLAERVVKAREIWEGDSTPDTLAQRDVTMASSLSVFCGDLLRWAHIVTPERYADLAEVVRRRLSLATTKSGRPTGVCIFSRRAWSSLSSVIGNALTEAHIGNFELLGLESWQRRVLPPGISVRRTAGPAQDVDDEGLLRGRHCLIDHGVVVRYLISLQRSYETGLPTAGGGSLDAHGDLQFGSVGVAVEIGAADRPIMRADSYVRNVTIVTVDYGDLSCVASLDFAANGQAFRWLGKVRLIDLLLRARRLGAGRGVAAEPGDSLEEIDSGVGAVGGIELVT